MSLLTNTENKLTEYSAELMIYFEKYKLIEIAKKILVECALLKPEDPQKWIGENIKRIASEIYQDCLHPRNVIKSLFLSSNFLYRIVLFGRPGSGRKTQAFNLVKRFNLVLIDAEQLILKHLKGDDNNPFDSLDFELQRSFYYNNCWAKSKALLNILARRVLEQDCLHRGWVLINFTHSLQDFRDILENFKLPPNKLVYLQCCERTCLCRLLNMPNFNKPQHNFNYYEQEMRFFNQQESAIEEYLRKRYETIFVNAELSSEQVKCFMMSYLTKSPYLMGFRRDLRD
ncbi:adenylate kinase 8 [Cochliomyia hominivorax]